MARKRPVKLDQLSHVQMIVGHPRCEHIAGPNRTEMGLVRRVPIRLFQLAKPIKRCTTFIQKTLQGFFQVTFIISSFGDPTPGINARPRLLRLVQDDIKSYPEGTLG